MDGGWSYRASERKKEESQTDRERERKSETAR